MWRENLGFEDAVEFDGLNTRTLAVFRKMTFAGLEVAPPTTRQRKSISSPTAITGFPPRAISMAVLEMSASAPHQLEVLHDPFVIL